MIALPLTSSSQWLSGFSNDVLEARAGLHGSSHAQAMPLSFSYNTVL